MSDNIETMIERLTAELARLRAEVAALKEKP